MKVIVFGATGMIGQGVLDECLRDPGIDAVLTVGRKATGRADQKLRELVHADLLDLSPIAGQLVGYDACFFCLGTSSSGMTEEAYHRVTFDIPMVAARALAASDPKMTFVYLSGAGTDSSEKGRVMWARVKGKAENAVEKLPFAGKYAFRPAMVEPMPGVSLANSPYRGLYKVMSPLFPVLRLAKGYVTSTDRIGRAMIRAARDGADKFILENRDINRLAG